MTPIISYKGVDYYIDDHMIISNPSKGQSNTGVVKSNAEGGQLKIQALKGKLIGWLSEKPTKLQSMPGQGKDRGCEGKSNKRSGDRKLHNTLVNDKKNILNLLLQCPTYQAIQSILIVMECLHRFYREYIHISICICKREC